MNNTMWDCWDNIFITLMLSSRAVVSASVLTRSCSLRFGDGLISNVIRPIIRHQRQHCNHSLDVFDEELVNALKKNLTDSYDLTSSGDEA